VQDRTEKPCPVCGKPVTWIHWSDHYDGGSFPLDHECLPAATRPDWHEYFFNIASAVAQRATCPRAKCGAVIVSADHHILSTGYNGAPPDERHCIQDGCIMEDGHCQRSLHAEVNAVAHAGREIRDGIMYISAPLPPCRECVKVMRAAGLTWVWRDTSGNG